MIGAWVVFVCNVVATCGTAGSVKHPAPKNEMTQERKSTEWTWESLITNDAIVSLFGTSYLVAMQRIGLWVARVLVMGMLVFPICPMIAQAHGAVLVEHTAMHGGMMDTGHPPRLEAHIDMEPCCATTSTVTPAIEGKNGMSFPVLCCMTASPAETHLPKIQTTNSIERNLGPPDQKFETRSSSKRE